jgi:hypothetical protein
MFHFRINSGPSRSKLAIPDAARPVTGIRLTCFGAASELCPVDGDESASARTIESSELALGFNVQPFQNYSTCFRDPVLL